MGGCLMREESSGGKQSLDEGLGRGIRVLLYGYVDGRVYVWR